MSKTKKVFKYLFLGVIFAFAAAGMFFIGGFLLTKYHITDVPGIVDANSNYFQNAEQMSIVKTVAAQNSADQLSVGDINQQIAKLESVKVFKMENFCKTRTLIPFAGENVQRIMSAYTLTHSDSLRSKMISAAELRLLGNPSYALAANECANINPQNSIADIDLQAESSQANPANVFPWTRDERWPVIMQAMAKDKDAIDRAAQAAGGVDPRLIAASLFVEQSRLYTTEREYFKTLFEPLKILATTNKFSLGTMSIKDETAKQIENNLTDANSPYYLGAQYEHLLDFKTPNHDQERYARLTDTHDHYYSYLYGALYIRQLELQWQKAGYPIADRPEIIATLFNISFKHSNPSSNPQAGGSKITVDGIDYTFGGLAFEYYYSGEMVNVFPYQDGQN